MNMKKILFIIFLYILSISSLFAIGLEDLQIKPVTIDRLKYFPVPEDNKNYFFLQAIESDSFIVIGDFSGVDKRIILIEDKNSDNTVDSVVEYYPLTKNYRILKKSESKFFTTDLAKLKRDIITGNIYRGNYADDMKSIDALEAMLKKDDKIAISEDVYSVTVRLLEIDETKRPSAQFVYGKNAGGYFLQFKTDYYRKNFATEIKPILKFSVYCKDTNDSVVKESVENLFKIRAPRVIKENK
ncbi:MAG TPA: hypothetical protein PKX79_08935 [Spirochaetota bacterium]|nr:hypothetical protein [Spirochaetota bacterium]HOK92836.1 hypothetical protein [Spirochaetota bacterium]HON15976.1 hypothetical protein [Spirochaetota bacterium]HPD77911.1 hypothetical protein [Spirochaetota bacterium]HPP95491.1 hypothetical protein [Spirochaetota bacterium]